MIESALSPSDVSAAARALRAIPSAKRTAAVLRNLEKAHAARRRNYALRRHLQAIQLPRLHRPGQALVATGVAYCPARMRLRPSHREVFWWIVAAGQEGITRRELALLIALYLQPVNPGRSLVEANHHLRRCGLIATKSVSAGELV